MKKLIAILVFSFLFVVSLSAGNSPKGTKLVSGKVLDKQTGETLTGVKIQVKGTDTYCYTDMEGNFILSVNTNNTLEVVVDMVGYEQTTLKTQELSLSSDIVLNPL
ncbi:MAG TPA: carboxypeptidase-like regulatory domain-containing protein [Bacteroidia bacterium]|nr:carboxypeptidase-like regulatory domain-containing protein [Bacteroidia bacterium]